MNERMKNGRKKSGKKVKAEINGSQPTKPAKKIKGNTDFVECDQFFKQTKEHTGGLLFVYVFCSL